MRCVDRTGDEKLHLDMTQVFVPETQQQIQVLLDLADDPQHDIHSTMDYGPFALVVPDELMLRYHTYMALTPSSPPEEPKKEKKR